MTPNNFLYSNDELITNSDIYVLIQETQYNNNRVYIKHLMFSDDLQKILKIKQQEENMVEYDQNIFTQFHVVGIDHMENLL